MVLCKGDGATAVRLEVAISEHMHNIVNAICIQAMMPSLLLSHNYCSIRQMNCCLLMLGSRLSSKLFQAVVLCRASPAGLPTSRKSSDSVIMRMWHVELVKRPMRKSSVFCHHGS